MRSNRKLTPLMERRILTHGSTIQKMMLQEYHLLNEEKALANYAYNEGVRLRKLGKSEKYGKLAN